MKPGVTYTYDPEKKKLIRKREDNIPKGYTKRQRKQLKEEEDPGIIA